MLWQSIFANLSTFKVMHAVNRLTLYDSQMMALLLETSIKKSHPRGLQHFLGQQ